MNTTPGAPILDLQGVSKTFDGVSNVLQGVDMAVRPGSVHGLVGANGAGKSTLLKIIGGIYTRSAGVVRWKGQPVEWTRPAQALGAGLSTVPQHAALAPTMSVLDNVFMGHATGPWWTANARRSELEGLMERLDYTIDPEAVVSDLSVGEMQMVSLMQALSRGADLILLDEPTASLTQRERDVVFASVRRLAAQGTTFVYVSHFLDEVLDLTDRITVLRDGRLVLEEDTEAVTQDGLVSVMLGRDLARLEEKGPHDPDALGEVVLEVRDLRPLGQAGPVSFDLREGEILGVAGLLGSGRSELLMAMFGEDKRASGAVRVRGTDVARSGARAAVKAGIALIPEDRNRLGLFPEWDIVKNASATYLPAMSVRGFFPRAADEKKRADDARSALGIRCSSVNQTVGELSGGNAQKVVFAKWVPGPASVLLLDEPTVGIDVGAKAELLQIVERFGADARSVILVSSEFEELLAVCTRILVIRRGEVIADLASSETSLHELTALASGL